jgi:tRNA threonylcarbamoyladenosine biosynthesis protein TsaB
MSLILCLETATTVCSVAVERNGELLAVREVDAGFTHAENITVFINEVCAEAHIKLRNIDACAVSRGPGSYTGLRIGASTAKGLCYALEKPLIAIDTLKILAASFLKENQNRSAQTFFLIPMIDARRMEVYCSAYDNKLNQVSDAAAVVLNVDSFNELRERGKLILFGDGSSKCKSLFENNPEIEFADVRLSAAGMISLAEEKFGAQKFEDVSLFEPFYLKEPSIGKTSGV